MRAKILLVGPSCQGENHFFARNMDALPCMRRYSWWIPAVRGANRFFCPDTLPGVRRCSWWVPAVRGRIIFLPVILTHFLACEDVPGGSRQSEGKHFFVKYGGPFGGSLLPGGGIIILRVIRRHFLAAAVDPAVSLSTYSTLLMEVVP